MTPSGTEKNKNLNANMVIIGSGGGLVAAAAAAEKGIKDIIVLEKKGSLGGVTKMAQGLFACESPLQKREQITVDKDVCFKTCLVKFGGWGYAHILRDILPFMKREHFSDSEIETILIENPKKMLTV